jgi:predicted nucleic acid-binding protein
MSEPAVNSPASAHLTVARSDLANALNLRAVFSQVPRAEQFTSAVVIGELYKGALGSGWSSWCDCVGQRRYRALVGP